MDSRFSRKQLGKLQNTTTLRSTTSSTNLDVDVTSFGTTPLRAGLVSRGWPDLSSVVDETTGSKPVMATPDRMLIVCPTSFENGERSVKVICDDGEEIDVPVPASVSPGDTFEVLLASASESESESEEDDFDEARERLEERAEAAAELAALSSHNASASSFTSASGAAPAADAKAWEFETPETKIRRLQLENNMLSAAMQLYEQRAAERDVRHELAMIALQEQLGGSAAIDAANSSAAAAAAPAQQQPAVGEFAIGFASVCERPASNVAIAALEDSLKEANATAQKERTRANCAGEEAVQLRRDLADVGAEVDANRARADRCLAVVRKLQSRMDAMKLRAMEHGLELNDTWGEGELAAARGEAQVLMEEESDRREAVVFAAQAHAETRVEAAVEHARDLEEENAQLSAALQAMEDTIALTLSGSHPPDAQRLGPELNALKASGPLPLDQPARGSAAAADVGVAVDLIAGLKARLARSEVEGSDEAPTTTAFPPLSPIHRAGEEDYTDPAGDLDPSLFFLPEAPIQIQAQLKIVEQICAEAVAERDSMRIAT